jgi:ABC-type nitrate/sulfonate/bicarbonate transport system substrate-binding protein
MKKTIIIFVFVLIAGAAVFFVFNKNKNQPVKYVGDTDDVNVMLKWIHQAQFAGNYVAAEKGFYKEQGVEVNLIPYSEENKPIDAVVSGRATFGITGADELILAREKGLPVKAFGVIYKINPVAAYSLKKSGITKPSDFVGKTVGIEKGINVEYLYSAMMSKLKIDRSKINEIAIGPTATELLEGKTDVSTGYVINEPQQAIAVGQDVNIILMADYGVNMYADVLFATENTIATNPSLVERFLRGTLEGWQYAIENVDEAVNITLKYATGSTRSHEEYMLNSSLSLINDGESPLGWMDKNKWAQVSSILHEQNIFKKEVNVSDAYTMQFLNKIYNKN